MMKSRKYTLAKRIALGLVIGQVMVNTGLAYAADRTLTTAPTDDTYTGMGSAIRLPQMSQTAVSSTRSRTVVKESITGEASNNKIYFNAGSGTNIKIYGGQFGHNR